VRVVDYMGDDTSIVQSARVSYGKGTKQVSTDKERGSLRTFKVSIYMRGIVDFSTDLEYREYFSM